MVVSRRDDFEYSSWHLTVNTAWETAKLHIWVIPKVAWAFKHFRNSIWTNIPLCTIIGWRILSISLCTVIFPFYVTVNFALYSAHLSVRIIPEASRAMVHMGKAHWTNIPFCTVIRGWIPSICFVWTIKSPPCGSFNFYGSRSFSCHGGRCCGVCGWK